MTTECLVTRSEAVVCPPPRPVGRGSRCDSFRASPAPLCACPGARDPHDQPAC